jgi:hypothetical protein
LRTDNGFDSIPLMRHAGAKFTQFFRLKLRPAIANAETCSQTVDLIAFGQSKALDLDR